MNGPTSFFLSVNYSYISVQFGVATCMLPAAYCGEKSVIKAYHHHHHKHFNMA